MCLCKICMLTCTPVYLCVLSAPATAQWSLLQVVWHWFDIQRHGNTMRPVRGQRADADRWPCSLGSRCYCNGPVVRALKHLEKTPLHDQRCFLRHSRTVGGSLAVCCFVDRDGCYIKCHIYDRTSYRFAVV